MVDPALPLSAEEEAELREALAFFHGGRGNGIGHHHEKCRLLATLDAAREAPPAARPVSAEPELRAAAQAVVDGWMQPSLENAMAFDGRIAALRAALGSTPAKGENR